MRRHNQYTVGGVRPYRLPTVAVNTDERVKVEKACDALRISSAQLQRAALVAFGVLDESSLHDVPEVLAERALKIRNPALVK